MVPLLGWAATLLTFYLAGRGWHDPDVFACWTPTSERDDCPPLPGGFPGTMPPPPFSPAFQCSGHLLLVSPLHSPLKRRARQRDGTSLVRSTLESIEQFLF